VFGVTLRGGLRNYCERFSAAYRVKRVRGQLRGTTVRIDLLELCRGGALRRMNSIFKGECMQMTRSEMRVFQLAFLIAVSGLIGCSFSQAPSATKISDVRAVAPTNRETVQRTVARRDFQAAVDRSVAGDRLRLVPVFRRETAGGGIPEYRLFDVGSGTPYALLGLQTADILIAANDYLVYEPEGFRKYVKLLGAESTVSLEVVRSGKATLLVTTLTD
jgi:hypothetical protein